MSVIKVKNACKKYQTSGELTVLDGFTMNVDKGQIYAMMGASGSGKTTLLSCLVGINSLDSGSIELFGQPMSQVRKTRLGYMPQEISLISGFTVKEMIYFFGIIAGLSKDKISERFNFLHKLLELPDKDRLTRDCSGGQQRRISFAVALVHEPEILVLDEPTVGLDFLLREKIWDYLVDISKTKKVTVLLTTHYIEEAGQATCIGLMRNGVQVAEDSPRNLLQTWETDNLEDAFLKMSERQEAGLPSQKMLGTLETVKTDPIDTKTEIDQDKNSSEVSVQTTKKVVQALLMKHYLEIVRNFGVFLIILIIPLIGCVNLHYGVGGRISGIKIGIVNNEVDSMNECSNKTLTTPTINGFNCVLRKSSCRFLDELDPEYVEKVYYKNYVEAYSDLKKGNLMGVIQFAFNFTESLVIFSNEEVLNGNRNTNLLTDNGDIEVILDQSELQKTLQTKQHIYDAYQSFIEGLMVACDLSKNAGNIPIVFENYFGSSKNDYKPTMVSGLILAQCFLFSSYLTSMSIITERTDGTWDRAIVAGVQPYHFIVSHLIEGIAIGFLQFLMYAFYLNFVLAPVLTSNVFYLVSMILLFQTVSGVTFGLFVSTITRSVMAAFIVAQVFCYPVVFISGIAWPIEAASNFLQIIGKMFPFAFSTAALRSIMVKDTDISNSDTYMSLVVMFCWIIGTILLSFKFINSKN